MFRSDVKIHKFSVKIQDLLQKLPHGNGIGLWYIDIRDGDSDGRLVTCYNSYRVTENGCYVGGVRFVISFYSNLPIEFYLGITDDEKVAEQYPDAFFGARDYLEDIVYRSLIA